MMTLMAFLKKEWMEIYRTGKFWMVGLLFVVFGIMSPAITKLTPWMMDVFSASLADSGLVISSIQVDALSSWNQFFKNMPLAMVAFVLMIGDQLTKEYKSGSLLLMLTKGLPRYQVILAKGLLWIVLWTLGYWLSFFMTYGYNAYYWDNGIVSHLAFAGILWWLFGIWICSLLMLFSSLLNNSTSVCLSMGILIVIIYMFSLLPDIQGWLPTMLLNTEALLSQRSGLDTYTKAIIMTTLLSIGGLGFSLLLFNKKQL